MKKSLFFMISLCFLATGCGLKQQERGEKNRNARKIVQLTKRLMFIEAYYEQEMNYLTRIVDINNERINILKRKQKQSVCNICNIKEELDDIWVVIFLLEEIAADSNSGLGEAAHQIDSLKERLAAVEKELGIEPPADDEDTTDADAVPDEAAKTPDDAATVPDEAAKTPDDAATVPDEAAKTPDDAATVPDEAAKTPDDAATVPDEAAKTPDDAATVPDEAAKTPDDAATVPDEAAKTPDDAATVPDEAAKNSRWS